MLDVKLSCTKDPTCKGFYQIYQGRGKDKDEHVKCESGYEKRELFNRHNAHNLYIKGIVRQTEAINIGNWNLCFANS